MAAMQVVLKTASCRINVIGLFNVYCMLYTYCVYATTAEIQEYVQTDHRRLVWWCTDSNACNLLCSAVWVMHNTANYKLKRPIYICPVCMAFPLVVGLSCRSLLLVASCSQSSVVTRR